MAMKIASPFPEVQAAREALKVACSSVVARLGTAGADDWMLTVSHALEAGLSSRDIAVACGVAGSTVSRWADGSTVPSRAARQWIRGELCRQLGVEPEPEASSPEEGPVVVAAAAV